MAKIFYLILIIFLFAGQSQMTAQEKYNLEIKIENIRSEKGKIFFQFLDFNQKVLKEIVADIENGTCVIQLSGLKPGDYAFRYFHDENNNGKLDKNMLGIPREGFGFSNDPPIMVGEPSFDKWLFNLREHKKMRTAIRYF
jgi:uncharacterized protein (DUF2141 family)